MEPATVVRCPYCMSGQDFLPMRRYTATGIYLCSKCGHCTDPTNPAYVCQCINCAKKATE